MYLKKLAIFGFKSFANKTELVFEPGITAVVGPNGCGKSNISDSIKWVLGEQSAKELRGSKMEDIIFNGTDETQPVNLAEVSLTLSNKERLLPVDYDEVIITRKVYRSGESEYYFNKTQVRLKDIMNILAGTGIGVSSYSIAEQGKMDRVLNARPEDRREIFEEASGITKYKTKRKEALNKLEHTENNLTRLADIINEVKRQIGSIERQAKKAEKYSIEFEKLKTMDLKLAFYEYKILKEEEGSTKQDNESLKQKEGHLSLELNVQQDELRIQRGKINSFDGNISEVRERASTVSGTIDKNENTIKMNQERIDELSKRSEALNREMDEINKRVATAREKIASVESEFNLINNEKEKRETFLTQTEGNLNSIIETIKGCEKFISDSKLTTIDNIAAQSRIKSDLSKLSASLATTASRHRRLNIEKENIGKEKDEVVEKLAKEEELFAQQKKILDGVLGRLDSLKDVFEQMNANYKEKSSVIEKLKQRFASSGSKLELLKDLKKKKEGFSEGVKAYMEFIEGSPQAKESFVGIVADLIEAEDGHVTAVEAVLGERSQLIALRSREALREALSYLKNEKKGKAQFIVMDELTEQTDGAISPAAGTRLKDYIKVRDEHRYLLDYLLKDTYLVDEIDTTEQRPDGVLFVTKDGSMSDGIVTSGGYSPLQDEYTSIIGRDAKIRELSSEVEMLRNQISDYEIEHLRMGERLKQISKEVDVLKEDAKGEEIKFSGREAEKGRISEHKDKLQDELIIIDTELEEIKEEEDSLKSREEELKQELTRLESEHQDLESSVSISQTTITEKLSEKEKAIVQLAELRTQMSLVNEKFDAQNDALRMLKDSLGNEEGAAEDRTRQLQEASERSSSLNQDAQRLVEENKGLDSQRIIVTEELSELQKERKVAYATVEEAENKTHEKQKELDEMRSKISSFHISLNELNYKASSIRERMHSSYKVDMDEETIVLEGDEDWENIATEVEELREKIDKLGPVNLVAIEEHKELQERYDFLTSQQQDLLSAKETLHKAINKINRTTRKMFIETFEQIKVAFKDYFKLLFGGGTAELFLMDQSDILESGIDIVVRPPGKKLQTISLLSGGEKALTAVALLFALFKVRPTPFCVLDEIDAPLDEANIDRFSRILQEFIKSTQFIIITHNKKTISISDILYGITMEKSGISKIVSVKFAEDQKKISRKAERSKPLTVEAKPEIKEPASEPQATETVGDGSQGPPTAGKS